MAMRRGRGWLALAGAGLLAFGLAGCGGGDSGSSDATGGTGGTTTPTVPTGPGATALGAGVVDSLQLTYDDLKNRALAGKILNVDVSGNQPVVKFQVWMKDTLEGVRGLRTFSLHLAQLKPAANSSPSYWQNYIADGLPVTAMPATTSTAITNPGTDAATSFNTADGSVKAQGYKVVDGGDGTYTVTFGANVKANAKVPFDPTLVHRVVVGVRSVAVPGVVGKTPGAYAGPLNPLTGAVIAQFTNTNGVNLAFDFMPSATGPGAMLIDGDGNQAYARDIVTIDACNQCHYKIQYGFPRGNNTSGHFGSRTDTKTCVMCHTPQNTSGQGDMSPMIHKIHMGERLDKVESVVGIPVNEVRYPQDQRNCTTCHKGTLKDTWKTASKKACGSCHNGVNFDTGAGHVAGVQPDSLCSVCHSPTSVGIYHIPVSAVANSNVPSVFTYYADYDNMPAGAAKITWTVKSVTVDAERKVSVQFQVFKDGTAVNFGTYNATTNPNIIPNTRGGPSLRIAFNVPQDGIASPADFNATMSSPAIGIGNPSMSTSTATPPSTFTPASTSTNLWVNGTVTSNNITWTMTGPDANNVYTIRSSLVLPASTTMVTALMYGTMTLTNVPDYPYSAASATDFASYVNSSGATAYVLKNSGLLVEPPNSKASATGGGFVARRTIVDNAKCLACHDQLGRQPSFHGGGRNDGTACNICHMNNSNNGGWSYGFNTFVHGIHGGALRTTKYTFAEDWSTVGYPGLLKNCEQCHIAGTYDYTASASSSVVDRLLMNTVGTGTTGNAGASTSPYIAQTAGTVYGSGFSASTSTGAVVTTEAAATTLVVSPITASCVSCHDNASAIAHFRGNGGTFYEPRAAAAGRKEVCLTCHGPANNALFNETVPAIKTVHRWW